MSPRRLLSMAATLTAAVLLTASCSRTNEATRASVVETATNDFITPVYERLSSTTTDLSVAVSDFCDEPSETTLLTVQTGLAETEAAWHRSATVRIGPTKWRRTMNAFSTKADGERIEALIDNDEIAVLDTDFIGSRTATTQRGLGTVRYLLGGLEGNESVSIDSAADLRRCEYLSATSDAMRLEAVELNSEWTESWNDGSPYIEILLSSDPEKTVDELVNNSIFVLEELYMVRLQALIDRDAPAEFGGIVGDIAFRNRFDSVRQILVGSDGVSGLSGLVTDDLAQRLRDQTDQIETINASISQLADPNDSTSVEELRLAVEQLQITASTDLASQLGVTLAFSDADGDSG